MRTDLWNESARRGDCARESLRGLPVRFTSKYSAVASLTTLQRSCELINKTDHSQSASCKTLSKTAHYDSLELNLGVCAALRDSARILRHGSEGFEVRTDLCLRHGETLRLHCKGFEMTSTWVILPAGEGATSATARRSRRARELARWRRW